MVKYGMVGGGPGAFIGDVHRRAIGMDGLAQLVAGCFSRDIEKSRKFAETLNVSSDRVYENFAQMAEEESKRDDCIKFVVCVTPNSSHFAVCKAFLEKGINVVCDKPLTWTSEESAILCRLAEEKGLLFGVTYTYSGYPCIKQIRHMVKSGQLGKIRFINAEYPQGWLGNEVDENSKLAPWRMNPKVSGATNCLGDIGTHIENLVSVITGFKIKRVSARLDSLVEGRTLDDNAVVNIEYTNGCKGLYWSSQIAFGYDNAVRVRIFGEKGSVEWVQEDPDHFQYTPNDGPKMIMSRGRDEFAPQAQKYSRVPAGHQEGLFEAFANIYRTFVTALIKKENGEELTENDLDFPSVQMGYEGVRYVEKCLESSKNDAAWVEIN